MKLIFFRCAIACGMFFSSTYLIAGELIWNGQCDVGYVAEITGACTDAAPCTVKAQSGSTIETAGTLNSEDSLVMIQLNQGETKWWAEVNGVQITQTLTVTCP